jgi:hypothetical protein
MIAAEIFSKNKSQTIFPFFVTLKVTLTMVNLGLQKYPRLMFLPKQVNFC